MLSHKGRKTYSGKKDTEKCYVYWLIYSFTKYAETERFEYWLSVSFIQINSIFQHD